MRRFCRLLRGKVVLLQFLLDLGGWQILFFNCGGNLRTVFLGTNFARVKMYPFRSVIYRKEKQDAGEQIQPKGIHVADALAGEKLIC